MTTQRDPTVEDILAGTEESEMAAALDEAEEGEVAELKSLVQLFYDVQKFRIRGGNRLRALERTERSSKRMKQVVEKLHEMEVILTKAIADSLTEEKIAPWLLAQRGIGPTLAGALIASGLNPNIDKPSAWWRFAGVGVVDGKNQRRRRGEKRSYNGFLRRTLFVLMGNFLRAHQPDKGKPSFYADLYYMYKRRSMEDPLRTKLEPIHHHNRASMQVARVFLSHLQIKWRDAEGLGPPRKLWIEVNDTTGKHEAILPPGP